MIDRISVTRVITFEPGAHPDVIALYSRRTDSTFRPTSVTLDIEDGEVTGVTVAGFSVLANGTMGQRPSYNKWYGPGASDIPQWVRPMIERFTKDTARLWTELAPAE